jgi:HD superfamily phosphohydrolase
MILARYHMFRTVYGHRNRVVTDLMLERALRGGVGTFLPADLLTLPDDASFLPWFEQYRAYDDWRVMSLGVEADNTAGSLFRRLRDHRLLKVLVFLEGEELRAALGAEHARQLGARREFKVGQLHEPLASDLGIPPEDVIVHMLDPRHVLQRDPLRLDDDINFIDANGDVQAFAERSEVFSAVPPERWRRQLVVYGPVSRRDDSVLAARAQATVLDLLRRELEGGS